MELYKEILVNVLKNQKIEVIFPDLKIDGNSIIESESYNALLKIKSILQDDTLEDSECFAKIEEIVCVFEGLGSDCGNRHDFG